MRSEYSMYFSYPCIDLRICADYYVLLTAVPGIGCVHSFMYDAFKYIPFYWFVGKTAHRAAFFYDKSAFIFTFLF